MAPIKNHNSTLMTGDDDMMTSLETYLRHTLEPVHPRREFIQGLRGRLVTPVNPPVVNHNVIRVDSFPEEGVPSIILILAGLLGSVVVIVTGIIAAQSIRDAIKFIRQRNHHGGNKASRSHSASFTKSASLGN